jgi:hypothetical protein
MAWSSPFLFYGTYSVTTILYGPGSFVADTAFDEIWDHSVFNPVSPFDPNVSCLESWDGDLTNSAGGLTGDQFNYTGTDLNSPHLPSSGTMHLFDIEIPGIAGPSSFLGQFCVDSGDFINNTYDWMFEDPSPQFGPICWDVEACPCGWAYFVDCPTSVDTMQWNETYILNLTTAAASNLRTYFSHLDDPTGHASFIVTDSTNDPNGQAQFTFTPDCGDVGLQTFEVGVYNRYIPYPSGMECTFEILVLNTCGDVNGDCAINIFDIVYLINYLYLEGPPPDPLESADVNNDGAVNIFDATYLISYLYLDGPPPICP